MGLICVVILCFSIALIKGKANRRENEVFAIPGCNATLEWILGRTYLTSYAFRVNVFNANGIEIARMHSMKCEHMIDSSMYCEVRNISDKEWRLSVVLVHVTQANSGKYTGQIAYGTNKETITKELKIIDKPQIRNSQKSILQKPLSTTCTVDGEFDDLIYHWKLNGTYFRSTKRINTNSSSLTFERLTMIDKFNIFSCSVCSEINCCTESESYTPDPYYGPDSVTLSLNESDIYLRVNESFKIKCSAKCHPVCSFLWDGYIHIPVENGELVINRFDSRIDGIYTCIATNPETNETAKSRPLFLHYVPDLSTVASSLGDNKATTEVPFHRGDNEGQRQGLYWLGPSLASVFLLIVGFLILVTLRRINASSQSGQSGSEVSRETLEMHNRLLTISTEPEHSSTPYRERLNSDNSLNNNCSWTCSVRPSVRGSRLVKMFERAKGDNKAANNDDNTGVKSQALNSSQRENLVSGLQEDLYNTVDEGIKSSKLDCVKIGLPQPKYWRKRPFGAAVSVYNYIQDNIIEETSHEAGRSTEHRYYDYAISVELYQDEMVSVNETDQTYITPISDLVRPIEICQNDEPNSHVAEEKDLIVTNENYITPISDFPSPIKICQTEDTDLHKTDPNYITPINGLANPVEICPVAEIDSHDRGKRRARSI